MNIRKSIRRKYRTFSNLTSDRNNISLKRSKTFEKLIYFANLSATLPVVNINSILSFPTLKELNKISYYHGILTQQETEKLLQNEGDFLIRNSLSHPDELILSCLRLSTLFHFFIKSKDFTDQKGVSKKFFFFETNEKEKFALLSELVNHHMYNRKPLTSQSGVLLSTPIKCLSRYFKTQRNSTFDEKTQAGLFDLKKETKLSDSQPALELNSFNLSKSFLGQSNFKSLPSVYKKSFIFSKNENLASKCETPHKTIVQGVFSATVVAGLPVDMDYSSGNSNQNKENNIDYCGSNLLSDEKLLKHQEVNEETKRKNGSPLVGVNKKKTPPPKPIRVATLRVDPEAKPNIKIREGLSNQNLFIIPLVLDSNSEKLLKLMQIPPLRMAYLITEDLLEQFNHSQNNFKFTIFEFISLPEGRNVRRKIIFRHYFLKSFVIHSILSSPNKPHEKEKQKFEIENILIFWIKVASFLVNELKNMNSFFTILNAVSSPQILRLKKIWQKLKNKNFKIFQVYEKFESLCNEFWVNPSRLSSFSEKITFIPFLLPVVLLMEFFQKSSDKKITNELCEQNFNFESIIPHFQFLRTEIFKSDLFEAKQEEFKIKFYNESKSFKNEELFDWSSLILDKSLYYEFTELHIKKPPSKVEQRSSSIKNLFSYFDFLSKKIEI